MTLYVSKHPGYSLDIHQGAYELQDITMPNGAVQKQMVPISPHMRAVFKAAINNEPEDDPSTYGIAPPNPYAIEYAHRYFEPRNKNTAGEPAEGSYREDRLLRIGVDAYDEEGKLVEIEQEVYTQGSNPAAQYSWFETDDASYYPESILESRYDDAKMEMVFTIPPRIKKLYEDRLARFADKDGTYIRVPPNAIPAPWPKYDEIKTAQGVTTAKVIERILTVADQIGVELSEVRSYERAHENRDYVISALDERIADQRQHAAEDEALSAPA